MSNKVTKTFNCKRKLKVNSSEPLDSEDISVQVGSDDQSTSNANNSESNPLTLPILWAHFQAYEQDLLPEGKIAPWEQIEEDDISTSEQKLWLQFLQNIVTPNLANWIHDPEEVRHRSIATYKEINSDNVETTDKETTTCSLEQILTLQLNLMVEAEVKNLHIGRDNHV
ncbi:hypothetical protein [Halanaerobaculum tunisiense]